MLDDLQPIIHKFPNGQDIKVYPISDLHVGSPQFDSKKWDVFRAKLISEPHSRIVLCGDLMNNGIRSSKSNVYEEVLRPSQQKAWLIEQLSPIADRILCGCSGNHERRTSKEVDQHPHYDVFEKLDIAHLYRENGCFLIMRFGNEAERQRQAGKDRPCYATVITHGTGGGMYVGSSANKAEQFGSVIDGIDVFVSGHVHKPSEMPVAKLVIDKHNSKVMEQQFRIVIATSWITYGGYGFAGAMKPTAYLLHEILYHSDSKLITVTS